MEKDININSFDQNSQSEYGKYLFGKAITVNQTKSMIIGVIDSSGSMSSCWGTLVDEWNKLVSDNFENCVTIIFSCDPEVVQNKYLEKSQVGGGTNIVGGFRAAYKEITRLSETEKDFTIIFVSDGEDGDTNTISERIQALPKINNVNINLICVGVGAGFPTFVGMELREKYHNGMSSIPAVFLVSDWKTEFETTFNSIREQYIRKLEKIRVDPPVKRFPWDEVCENLIFESSFFISSDPQVTFEEKTVVQTQTAYDLSKGELEAVFSSWTQELQLMSLKKSVRNEAKIAVEFMEHLYKIYDSKLVTGLTDKKVLTVLERLELKENKSGTHLLQSLIAECKKMRDGNSLKDLSAEEAAKRLAIGTKQGKFHSKALQMRGLNQTDYEKMREEFLLKLENQKLNPETKQEPSFILLQTQKEVFMETTLATAINKCNSYELVEVLPMIGQTLLIRRTDQSMINPYTIQVISIPRINKVCDTISLVSQGNEMEISIGNDEEEKFNAVIPLFEESDKDVQQLIRSKLYHLLMTFNVMGNVDTFFYEAYAGLLANTLIRLLKYPDSEWKTHLIDMVYSTTEMVYGNNPNFEKSVSLLLKDPRGAFVTEHKTESHKCEDVSKMMLNLLVLKKRGHVSEEQCQEIIKYMLIEHVGRGIREGTNVFEAYMGRDELQDFRLRKKNKDEEKNKKPKDKKEDIQQDNAKTETKNEIANNNVSEVIDINSYDHNVINIQSENVIDINSVSSNFNEEESLDSIVEKFIKNREHLKFDSIKDLKSSLKKIFLEFTMKSKANNSMNIRLVKDTFNKPAYRINFAFFYELFNYFCPALPELDAKLFWVAINHALNFRDSHDRSINAIEDDYEKIRFTQKKKFCEKQDKEAREKLYDGFEKPIINHYLADIRCAMKLVRDLHCNTDLLKTVATYDSQKKFVNVIFFGPYHSGKSSLVGSLLKQFGCVEEKQFGYYKTAYKTFYPNRENEPYEWISNTAVDERCKDMTSGVNISHLNLKNKFVNILDTPGKYQYYKSSLAAMSLANHFFLCIEPNVEKIKEEFEILSRSFPSLVSNGCKVLHVLLTKSDVYILQNNVDMIQNVITDIKKLFDDLLAKMKFNIKLEFLPVSAYRGLNLNELASLFESLESRESHESHEAKPDNKECPTKLLVLDTISNHFGDKVIYAQVFGNEFKSGASFLAYPSLKEGKIKNVNVNFISTSDKIKDGQYISIELNKKASELGIEKYSILHLGEAKKKAEEKAKIKEIKISLNYTSNDKFKINTCLKLEYKFFNETLQVTQILNEEGINITEVTEDNKKGKLTVTLVPTTKVTYFEKLWRDSHSDCVIIRGQHYKVKGIGKVVDVTYS